LEPSNESQLDTLVIREGNKWFAKHSRSLCPALRKYRPSFAE